MATVILVRHGRTAANAAGTLAGWTPGVDLDEVGVEQVRSLATRMAGVPLAAVVTSPLERARQTTELLLAGREVPVHVDDRVGECRYGDWTGRPLKELAEEPLWKVVQAHPSAVTFPGEAGESMIGMATRAVESVREWNERLGSEAVYAVVSHGDVIKAILADALGLHLDQFQRIFVNPASVSVVRYTPVRAFVERMNDSGGGLQGLAPKEPEGSSEPAEPSSDAPVGGGAGI